ncbi:MAG: hypothetical protein NZ750_13850 [Anaerolineae bacterium]|nr:hypothetical protein [Anaerolineae bacterium]MDW8172883.1 hypothetical protein [Anaerolineae bacterium]
MIIFDLIGSLGLLSVGGALIALALLSRRLSQVTRARKRYRWIYLAAACVWLGALARLLFLTGWLRTNDTFSQNVGTILIVDGLPALGVTIALVVVWHYWSWLLAERN